MYRPSVAGQRLYGQPIAHEPKQTRELPTKALLALLSRHFEQFIPDSGDARAHILHPDSRRLDDPLLEHIRLFPDNLQCIETRPHISFCDFHERSKRFRIGFKAFEIADRLQAFCEMGIGGCVEAHYTRKRPQGPKSGSVPAFGSPLQYSIAS